MAELISAQGDLTLTGLTKRFGDFTAVDNLDLVIPQGSFFALLGPSGCGKTTTLRMVAGLEEPTAGRIAIGGQDITLAKPYTRPVNTVFQNYALFPHLDVAENVAFGLRRLKRGDIDKKVKDALELVQLGHLAKRKPTQLSGGQQQRIALARAIVNRPQVLLLDEPLGALDLKLRRQMQLELKRIQVEVGLTFVHVTHDQEEAMTMADTIAVMNGGVIEQMGAPIDLYENPRTAFVANFLGQSNVFSATVDQIVGSDVYASDADGKYVFPISRYTGTTPLVPGSRVLLGVRPEKISIELGEKSEGVNQQNGIVADASFFGVSTQYVIDTPSEDNWIVFEQNLGEHGVISPGQRVTISWQPTHAFALDGHEDVSAGDTVIADIQGA